MQRNLARLALVLHDQKVVARVRGVGQAEHLHRHGRPGLAHLFAGGVEQRPHPAELLAGDDRVPGVQDAALDKHRGDGAAALLDARFEHHAGCRADLRRLEVEHLGLQQDRLEQLVDARRRYAPTR